MAQLDLDALFRMTEDAMIAEVSRGRRGTAGRRTARRTVRPNAAALQATRPIQPFRAARRCTIDSPGGRIRGWSACAEQFAAIASTALGRVVAPHEVLFDAPPVDREVQFNVDVFFPKEHRYRTLGDVSPVVRTLAREQFDDYVKRVRMFVHPRLRADLAAIPRLSELVSAAIDRADG